MPTTFLRLAALLMLMGALAQPARAQIGLAAGLNFDNLSDIDAGDERATFDNATGYHVGVFFDFAAGPLALRPGVFYRSVGEVTYDFGPATVEDASFDLSMIEVPIDVRLRLPLPLLKPYAMLGPVLRFASTEDPDFEDNLEDFTVAGNIGVGVEVALPGLRLFPEVRYDFGVSRFMREEIEVGGVTFEAEEGQRLSAVMIRLGIAL